MTITKPGVYADIPMPEYHGQLTDTPSISSSGLRTIENGSPAEYYAYSYLNPEPEEKSTPAMNLGKVAHALLLGEDHFGSHFVISPFDDFRKKEAREWRDNETRTIITNAHLTTVHKMATVLKADPLIEAGVLQGEIEKTIVWKDEETGVWLKSRPDVLPHDDWCADYKTAADVRPYKLTQSIMDYGYHMQVALVAEGLAALGRPVPTNFVLLFQCTKPPYSVQPVKVGWELVKWGAQQNRRAIRRFAECLEKGEWPQPEQQFGDFFGPDWFHKRMEDEESAGALPKAPAWVEKAKRMEPA